MPTNRLSRIFVVVLFLASILAAPLSAAPAEALNQGESRVTIGSILSGFWSFIEAKLFTAARGGTEQETSRTGAQEERVTTWRQHQFEQRALDGFEPMTATLDPTGLRSHDR